MPTSAAASDGVRCEQLTISLGGSHYEEKEGFLFQMAMKPFREDPASFVSSALPLFLLLLLGLLLDYITEASWMDIREPSCQIPRGTFEGATEHDH